jgi:hypothetical protein
MRWLPETVFLACALSTTSARADEDPVSSYGRVAGDLGLALGVGVVAAPRGPRGEAELRARYLDTAGVFVTYEDGALLGSSAEPTRVLAGGVELRPLFLYRWLQGQESGDARWDMLVDSFGIELGATLSQPAGQPMSQGGLQFGLGLELPLFPRASGPWIGLHGGVRWSDVALATGQVQSADDRSVYVAVTLTWQQVITTHLVDVRDALVR